MWELTSIIDHNTNQTNFLIVRTGALFQTLACILPSPTGLQIELICRGGRAELEEIAKARAVESGKADKWLEYR